MPTPLPSIGLDLGIQQIIGDRISSFEAPYLAGRLQSKVVTYMAEDYSGATMRQTHDYEKLAIEQNSLLFNRHKWRRILLLLIPHNTPWQGVAMMAGPLDP